MGLFQTSQQSYFLALSLQKFVHYANVFLTNLEGSSTAVLKNIQLIILHISFLQ